MTSPRRLSTSLGVAAVVVDARGEFCPVPVIRTSDAVKALPPGGTVLVIADDPAIEFDLPAWARSAGQECSLVRIDGRDFHYAVKKRAP
ncbi:MAG: sulfurtransferase TusA family protein [Candidatus Krumholzibacteria bacterium]|nr:sulfurtransferase TusA family protein [Candidatus Krumholzibacteria bacterium]MDH4336922.1 sulfurtransferase TusA family protein [Candidatus Krumholzibacteria bacterium]MDH5269782.1 sulfurtransferase TusA family protein [Candidatus Krumholzibacteria bacterium]